MGWDERHKERREGEKEWSIGNVSMSNQLRTAQKKLQATWENQDSGALKFFNSFNFLHVSN